MVLTALTYCVFSEKFYQSALVCLVNFESLVVSNAVVREQADYIKTHRQRVLNVGGPCLINNYEDCKAADVVACENACADRTELDAAMDITF